MCIYCNTIDDYVLHCHKSCNERLRHWEQLCSQICCPNRGVVVKQFMESNPTIWDWDQRLQEYQQLEDIVDSQTALLTFGPLHLCTGGLRSLINRKQTSLGGKVADRKESPSSSHPILIRFHCIRKLKNETNARDPGMDRGLHDRPLSAEPARHGTFNGRVWFIGEETGKAHT